jgi:heme-binding NEAT domain protein
VEIQRDIDAENNTLTFSMPVSSISDPTFMRAYAPDGMGETYPVFRLVFNEGTLTPGAGEGNDDNAAVTITSFDPITIEGGAAGAAAYADAAAVIAYLNANYVGVTANGGAVTVPVTGWTATDGYNTELAGSYTFTAVLGAIPAGYANPGNLKATAEVVISQPEEDTEIPADGLYTIDADALMETSDSYSMTNQFLTEPARLTVSGGQITMTMVWHGTQFIPMTMVKGLWYRNAAGAFVEIQRNIDAENNTLTFSMPVSSISDPTFMRAYAPDGMGETYPVFRLVFNEGTLAPVTAEPDPESLADGLYTIDADALMETSDSYSMTNQFLTVPAGLTVEDGRITMTMVWHGTQFIPMTMVKGLWYKNAAGDFVEIQRNIDAENNTLTFSMPVSGITEPIFMRAYAPDGMGETYPVFRLVFNEDTLAREGESVTNPDNEPVREITASGGAAAIGRDDIRDIIDQSQNIRLNLGDVFINFPVRYLNNLLAGDTSGAGSLQLQKNETSGDTQQNIFGIMAGGDTLVGAIDLNLQLVSGENSQPVTELGGRVKITISLTDEQAAKLDAAGTMRLCYYNPAAGALEDMGAVFDLTAKTVTFYTDHFSTYVIIGATYGTGGSGGSGGDDTGISDGSYTIEVSALMESSGSHSMANQFIRERAGLQIHGDTIDVTMVWYGTTSSPQSDDGIHMSSVKKLQYKDKSGSWDDVTKTLNTANDTLIIELTVSSISNPVYMRVQADEMGPGYKVFRLVFDEDSLEAGSLDMSAAAADSNTTYTIKATAGMGESKPYFRLVFNEIALPPVAEEGDIAAAAGIDMSQKGEDPAGEEPEPESPADGEYTIDIDAMHETEDKYSTTNQFLTEPAKLTVRNGKIKVAMVWRGNQYTTMDMVQGLWYKDGAGTFAEAPKKLDAANNTLTVTLPVESITEPVIMQVYAPAAGSEGGSISPGGDVGVKDGSSQTFTISAGEGYKIKEVLVDDEPVGAVNDYTFKNVKADHTIHAIFENAEAVLEEEAAVPAAPADQTVPVFKDTASHWAEKIISFAVSKGVFDGTGDGLFSPDAPMTRGMFATSLGRLNGIEAGEYAQVSFTDVSADKYYAPYVQWARENGIVNGVNDNSFAPDEAVTREEAAVIFANYSKFAGISPDSRETAAEPALQETVTESTLRDGRYTAEASALREASDELSMTDQMVTEKVVLNVANGVIAATTTLHGTEYVTMDMIKELKYQKADGSFVEVDRVLDMANNTLTLNFEIADINKATIMQVYVPAGMGESRPKFRLVLDAGTLAEMDAGAPPEAVTKFADERQISDWAKDSVEALQKAGLIAGDKSNRFNPQKAVTRAEASVLFARSLGFAG